MVIYDLTCPNGHRFEGWFPNLEAFESQKEKGLLNCGVCGNTDVSKIPSGGHFCVSTPKAPASDNEKIPEKTPSTIAASTPLDPVVVLKALRHYVKNSFDNVGDQFPKAVRKMHKGEEPPRNIYGQVTPEEREKLQEEEIPFALLPDLPPEYEN
jgi:hypothetical protein